VGVVARLKLAPFQSAVRLKARHCSAAMFVVGRIGSWERERFLRIILRRVGGRMFPLVSNEAEDDQAGERGCD